MYQLYSNTFDVQINPLADKTESGNARKKQHYIYIYMHIHIKPVDTTYFLTNIQELYYIYICSTSFTPILQYCCILITQIFQNI